MIPCWPGVLQLTQPGFTDLNFDRYFIMKTLLIALSIVATAVLPVSATSEFCGSCDNCTCDNCTCECGNCSSCDCSTCDGCK